MKNLNLHILYILSIVGFIVVVLGAYTIKGYKDTLTAHDSAYRAIQAELRVLQEQMPEYAYNEKVPVEVVKAEIVKQAEQFGLDVDLMLRIADCESGFDNLAKNYLSNSTALGVYQWVIFSWQQTNSFKVYRRARTDYKHNIFEAALAISNGEISHWYASRSCWE